MNHPGVTCYHSQLLHWLITFAFSQRLALLRACSSPLVTRNLAWERLREEMMDISGRSSEPTPVLLKDGTLLEISHFTYAIIFPIIFLLGIAGNSLSSLLFTVTKLNRTSCGVYFLVLAIADTLALFGGLHHCLTIGYRLVVPHPIFCRLRNFIFYISMDMSSWMVVAISVDRYLKVKFPIKARMYATRRLAIIVSSTAGLVFLVKNVHLATTFIGDFTNDTADYCDPNPDHPNYVHFFKTIWPWIDLTTYALLPFLIVVICNGLIIRDQYKRRLKLRKRDLDMALITLLLVSSSTLILCNLPIALLAIIYPYVSSSFDTNDTYDNTAFAFDILRLPSYASLALNFYLYYYSSVIFRQQAVNLYRRVLRRQSKIKDIELTPRIYHEPGRLDHRLYSIDDPEDDDDDDSSFPKLSGSSFISNFYRQDAWTVCSLCVLMIYSKFDQTFSNKDWARI